MDNRIVVVAGPTASGKTRLGIELAQALGGEIVSADSMQIYRRMDIGTAKPDMKERQGVPHHLFDVCEPGEAFSVDRYDEKADAAAQEILSRYTANAYCQTHGVLLPVCSNQKMNVYLKELADICGIRKHLSTHTARHTFATLTLASGATIENVAKMLGHSDTKMTRHYARILDSSILRDMQTVAKNMAL